MPLPTAHDVIRALTDTHEKIATKLDNAPTGVTPGYHSALGGTVLPNGKLRYVTASAASAFSLLVEARMASSQTHTDDGTVINFGTVNYDPGGLVTTGASWHCAIAATGWYQLIAAISINTTALVVAAQEYWDLALNDITHSAQVDTIARLEFPAQLNGGISSSDFFLTGATVFHITSAPTSIQCAFETNQFTFGIDRTISGGRFALSQVG